MDGRSHLGFWPILRIALGALGYTSLCASALAVGAGFHWVQRSPLLMEAIKSPVADRFRATPFENQPAVTLLILGCDQELTYRGTKVLNKYARSDMMMVVRIDFESKKIGGLSIPRDTVVAAGGYRPQKINAYHVLGGADLSRQAVETLLPVTIDRVVVIDFDAFQQMVDLVGGVEVYVPKRMKHTDRAAKLFIDLQPGRQVLNGYDSMCFVRYRKTDDDFKRTERQRDFLLAFKQAVMRNPIKLPEVANKGKEVLGDALTDQEIVYLAKFAQAVGNDNIKVGMVPVRDVPGSLTFDLEIDDGRIQETLQQFHMAPSESTFTLSTP